MIIISDTNVLSSLAAGEAFHALCRLYSRDKLAIPPNVLHELQAGVEQGNFYLQSVLQAIQTQQIEVVPLSAEEELMTFNYPARLGAGEREAIALAQSRKTALLSNDNEAIRYCNGKGMRVISLVGILRLLWTEQIMSQAEVHELIAKMMQIEKLKLTAEQMEVVFPHTSLNHSSK